MGRFTKGREMHKRHVVLADASKARPTRHSTGPARKAAQAGDFERVCRAWHESSRVKVPAPGMCRPVCPVVWEGGAARLLPIPIRSSISCLLYTSDAADDLLCVDLGGRRIIKKKKNT